MQYKEIILDNLGVRIELAVFTPPQGQVTEWHAMLHVEPRNETFQQQYSRLSKAEAQFMADESMAEAQTILKRYFLSDSTNQQPFMEQTPCQSSKTHSVKKIVRQKLPTAA